jgi:hypothetical protein
MSYQGNSPLREAVAEDGEQNGTSPMMNTSRKKPWRSRRVAKATYEPGMFWMLTNATAMSPRAVEKLSTMLIARFFNFALPTFATPSAACGPSRAVIHGRPPRHEARRATNARTCAGCAALPHTRTGTHTHTHARAHTHAQCCIGTTIREVYTRIKIRLHAHLPRNLRTALARPARHIEHYSWRTAALRPLADGTPRLHRPSACAPRKRPTVRTAPRDP